MPVEAVVLDSLRHENQDGFGFPSRYKIEGSNDPEFSEPFRIADHTRNAPSNPGSTAAPHPAKVTARYVRVISGGGKVAANSPVLFKDTADNNGWHYQDLTDGNGFFNVTGGLYTKLTGSTVKAPRRQTH